MPFIECVRSVPVNRSARVKQLEGMFDVPPSEQSARRWRVNLPLEEHDWRVGLIVGPSGCGKSTIAGELFPHALVSGYDWPPDRAIVDAFPRGMGIGEISGLLSSVGFSSPPGWLRPFPALSNGEQFRVTIARALAEQPELAVIDEFTSVVDRTVARIGSAAVAQAIRRSKRHFVAVSCHYDVVDWLDPDWVYDPAADEFRWRSLRRRPPIRLEIARVHRQAWRLFKPHHYLSGELSPAAQCFIAFVGEEAELTSEVEADPGVSSERLGTLEPSRCLRPAAFSAVLHAPDAKGGYWREHRTVCLPDFQGVGIGNALSEFVAAVYAASGKRFCSRTSHPAMIRHRLRSKLWNLTRAPAVGSRRSGSCAAFNRTAALTRLTASFRYIGPADFDAARRFGLFKKSGGWR